MNTIKQLIIYLLFTVNGMVYGGLLTAICIICKEDIAKLIKRIKEK